MKINMKIPSCFFILVSSFMGMINTDNVGWSKLFEENSQEFHNVPLQWEKGETNAIPSWLGGVYVRNGPAQITFGSEKRHLSSWMDGMAKLHSFKFDGKNVFYSGKMIESSSYKDSVEKKELVPQITLGPFENSEEDWNMFEMKEIFERTDEQFNGNMEHNVVSIFSWRYL